MPQPHTQPSLRYKKWMKFFTFTVSLCRYTSARVDNIRRRLQLVWNFSSSQSRLPFHFRLSVAPRDERYHKTDPPKTTRLQFAVFGLGAVLDSPPNPNNAMISRENIEFLIKCSNSPNIRSSHHWTHGKSECEIFLCSIVSWPFKARLLHSIDLNKNFTIYLLSDFVTSPHRRCIRLRYSLSFQSTETNAVRSALSCLDTSSIRAFKWSMLFDRMFIVLIGSPMEICKLLRDKIIDSNSKNFFFIQKRNASFQFYSIFKADNISSCVR